MIQAGIDHTYAEFTSKVAAARQRPLLNRASMEGTSLALAVDAMLIETDHGVRALLPLRAPTEGRQAARLQHHPPGLPTGSQGQCQ